MNIKEHWGILRRVIGVAVLATALAACGGQTSSDSAPAATDNTAAVVSLSSALYAATVNRNLMVTINRSGASTGAATVGYTTVNGTATAGTDYVATSGTVSWSDGEMGAKVVTVPVLNGASGKDFGFALTSVQGGANFGSPAAATIGVSNVASALDSTSGSSSGGAPSSSGATSGSSSSSSGVTASNPPSGSSSLGGTSPSSSGTGFSPSFPRLATVNVAGAGGSSYSAAYAQYLALFNVNEIACYVGCGSSMYGGSRQAFIAAVKNASVWSSQGGTKFFQYYLSSGYGTGGDYADGLKAPISEANNFPNWWAWSNSDSTHVTNNGYQYNNPTIGALPSGSSQLISGGQNWEQWFAQHVYDTFVTGTGEASSSDVASNLDGFYHDVFLAVPEVAMDYNLSGSAASTSDANYGQSLRYGLASGAKQLKTLGTMIIGNINQWNLNPLTGYSGVLNGGQYQQLLGSSFSVDQWGGTSNAVKYFNTSAAQMAAPAIMILDQEPMSSNGSDGNNGTAYAPMRYGLTLSMILGAYYEGSVGDYGIGVQTIFDEFFVNPTTGVAIPFNGNASSVAAGAGYMGQPTSVWGEVSGSGAYQTIDGALVRMFYNAASNTTWVAICGPHNASATGGGPYTVSASALHSGSAGFKLIRGTQDPSVNSGSTVSSISLGGYDGRIAQLL